MPLFLALCLACVLASVTCTAGIFLSAFTAVLMAAAAVSLAAVHFGTVAAMVLQVATVIVELAVAPVTASLVLGTCFFDTF